MKPKKQSNTSYIVAFIALLLVLFVASNIGMAIMDKTKMENATGTVVKGVASLEVVLDYLNKNLNSNPFNISWNEHVKTSVVVGGFIWFIATAYYFTSRKKYITGKEFGTAEWSKKKDISDLFASNIMKKEIKNAKRAKSFIGRILGKLFGGKSWKPNILKKEYKDTLDNIAYLYEQGISITSEDKELLEQNAKQVYDDSLYNFYNGKDSVRFIRSKYNDADALYTKTEKISIYNYELNNNTLIMGGSGSGKTRSFVMPNILQAHSSFVVTDPKGEILEKAGHFLQTVKGYKIRVLNLDDKALSDGYNPFVYIHPERPGYEDRILMLVEAIIINTDGGEKRGGSDPFWDKSERMFLEAMFFFVCDGFVESERNMNTVHALISMLQLSEEHDNHDSDLDYFYELFKEEHGEDHIGVQDYKEFREKASGKTAKSIVISAVVRLTPFRTSDVRRLFSYDTMELDRLGEEKMAVFVVVPPTDSTFNFIAGMLFTQMFQELQYCATQVHRHEGQRLPVPVRFILDEFANTCTIPNFVKILAYARSFGIGIVPILQSLEQIKNMYKDEWGVVVDNCNTLLYLGSITHMDTLEYVSKLLGKGTFDKKTTGRTRGRSGSSSQNFDVLGRDLMDSSEIRKLPKKNCLFIVGGRNPFYSVKYEYVNHPNYKYTSDYDRSNSYNYVPQQAVKEVVAEEVPVPDSAVSASHLHVNVNKAELRKGALKKVNAVLLNVDNKAEVIEMVVDTQKLVTQFGKSLNHLGAVRDSQLLTDDGSIDSDSYLSALEVDAEDKRADEILLNMVRKKVEKTNLNIERGVKEDGIRVVDNPVTIANKFVTANQHIVPVADQQLVTDDGSEIVIEDNLVDGFILDSDEETFDMNDNDMSELQALLNDADKANLVAS